MRARGRRREQEASWPVVDLEGLEGTYVTAPALSRRARRVVWVVVGTLTAVRFALGDEGLVERVLDTVIWLLFLMTPLLLMVLRPPRTRLTPRALTARTDVLRERTTPWHDVVEVRPAGRWSEHSSAVLRDGTHLDLPGLSVEQAQQLAQVVKRQHPSGERSGAGGGRNSATAAPRRTPTTRTATTHPSSAAELPEDDLGLGGPFRSARRR